MAALQKIRSKGVLLVIVIGLALFAFIAEELVRSLQTMWTQNRQQVGSVYGSKISTQDYSEALQEYEEAYKFMQGKTTLSEAEVNQLKDQVWQTIVFDALIAHEADKLGLRVTDGELQQMLNEGTSPLLRSTPFTDQQTGRFSASQLKNFLQQYEQIQSGTSQIPSEYQEQYRTLYTYWQYVEKTLRSQLLQTKYQALLATAMLSNPVEAAQKAQGQAVKSELLVVGLPYASVNDNDVSVSDADVKALYEKRKESYKQLVESRDIKYVTFQMVPSEADKKALEEEMTDIAAQMETTDNLMSVVRNANSDVVYSNVWVSAEALPDDIVAALDSMVPGQQVGPYLNEADQTLNIIRYVAQTQAPDTIRYRMIGVGAATAEEAQTRADSIITALAGGAVFDSLATAFGQTGEEATLISSQYETSVINSEDDITYINTLNTLPVGVVSRIDLSQASIVVEVLGREKMVTKYNAAVVKRPYTFSKDTYSQGYNNFSRFVANSKTIDELEKNAPEYGLKMQTRTDLVNSEHYIAGLTGTSDALRWTFEAKAGEISPLYECGESDYLLLVALTRVNPVGYRAFDDVKAQLRIEVLNDKKAEKLSEQLGVAANIAAAQEIGGVSVDSLHNVTYSGATFLPKAMTMEPSINSSVWSKKAGDFVGPVKGNSGVYVYQVLEQTDESEKVELATMQSTATQTHMRGVLQMYLQDLYLDGKVKDERYKFF